ncbi:hypothetical protein Tco_0872334, partial [Tanacetum coccineum]
DLNVNLEGRDVEMIDAQQTNVQTTQVLEDTHVTITPVNPEGQQQSSSVSSGFVSNMLNPRPDTGIDPIFNTKATSLVDVSVITIAEPTLVFATTLPPTPTPFITHMQQTPFPIPKTALSTSLQDLPNFGSLFGFDHRLKTLETNFSKFKQMNQFAKAVSSIPSIIDAYLANKMNDAVKTAIQLQSDRLRDEAQAENEDFINKLDNNIKKIIKEQVKEQVKAQVSKILPKIEKTVNEQLEAEVMTRLSTESRTSLAIAANLSELEIKKILIENIESNKSINRSNEQKNIYKVLVEAYESDKLVLNTYGDTVLFKRHRDDEDKDEEPSTGSNRGSQCTLLDLEEHAHQEFDIGATEEQSDEDTSQHPDWFQKPAKLPTPDRDWNKTLPAIHGPVPPWLSNLAREEGPRESFDELMDTPLDFSAFMINRLKIDTLTPELLVVPTFKVMKGLQYPHDLRKPLPLIPNSRGSQVISFDHFINNDLAYLSGGVSSRTYATFVTKTKAANYGHIKWIKDLVPNTIWSEVPVNYDKHGLWGISHWGCKHQQFYGFAANRESARDEGDFKRLHLQDIKDMLILLVQIKLTNLNVEDRLAFGVFLRMFTRSIIIQRRVEDLQLAYSYPKGFIYLNKDRKNRLMRIDELQKFSDGTLDDVRTALNDQLKGIRKEYLPKIIWRHSDRERAKAMIQAIEKMLKSRRIMRSLERFVGRRSYNEHAEFDESDTHVLERFETSAGNPVKEILLKLNVPDHRSILTDSKMEVKQRPVWDKPMQVARPMPLVPCKDINTLHALAEVVGCHFSHIQYMFSSLSSVIHPFSAKNNLPALSSEGACVFTDKWSLDELAYGVPRDGPYQTNPPSPDDIISYIRNDREGQVTRPRHRQKIDVQDYQILTREILTNEVPRVFQTPPNIDPDMEPFYTR